MRAKQVGYYGRSEEVYFHRSDEGNASEASNLTIDRSEQGITSEDVVYCTQKQL